MIGIIIALLSGALMAIQGVFNTAVTKSAGIWATAGWVQITAFATCVIAWFISGRSDLSQLFAVDQKYLLLGGVIGAFITFTVIKSVDSLGPAKANMLIVICQLGIAYLIEVFGIFGVEATGFHWRKIVGMILAIAGIIVFN